MCIKARQKTDFSSPTLISELAARMIARSVAGRQDVPRIETLHVGPLRHRLQEVQLLRHASCGTLLVPSKGQLVGERIAGN